MGVPAFFRWLSRKYPSIIVSCVEEKVKEISGLKIPVDSTQPNPNDVEFDNLYLDMNGIIHPCCHPEDKPAPQDEDEMMVAIFEYIDRIFNIVRPRRLLYMAIDGVAPRAKMNQQRSRRFRSVKESREKREDIKRVRDELEEKGVELPPAKPDHAHFDSNCITPGTEFMANLAEALQYYIHDRLNHNPGWQGVKIILSDANVPGEGEHKIMDYIRHQRGQPDHDPNTHHCLYGADADLIMLGLATHEPHFTILREEFKPNQPRPCDLCGQLGHEMKECTGTAKKMEGEFDQFANSSAILEKQFIFLRICVLREYLERELRIDGLPFPFELERALDDWVFMCFFVGNDFLPHLPSLEIRENAIDRLIRLYKQVVPQTNGYLTHNGTVNLGRVQMMMSELGKVEDEIFRNRRVKDQDFKRRNKEKKRAAKRRRSMYDNPLYTPQGQFAPTPLSSHSPLVNPRQEAYHLRQMSMSVTDNKSAAASLRNQLKKSFSVATSSPSPSPSPSRSFTAPSPSPFSPSSSSPSSSLLSGESRKRKREEDSGSESEAEDNVRLWEDGWKGRYYSNKFGVPADDEEFVASVTEAYTRGLCWVLAYYYQGCPSWKWYYPFHYAPFASDFKDITNISNKFDKGSDKPFKPLEQLMGVFPAASGGFIPKSFRSLMTEEFSPIIDFYPSDFKVDLNGKKYMWQGVALLPFVDETRLLGALEKYYNNLSEEETKRNSLGSDKVYVFRQHGFYSFIKILYETSGGDEWKEPVQINPQHTHGVRGTIFPDETMKKVLFNKGFVSSPVPSMPDIKKSFVIGAKFKDPHYPSDHIFTAALLPNAVLPEKALKPGGSNFNGPPGSYRPQLGFNAWGANYTPVGRGVAGQRMIRHALSEPWGRRPPTHAHSHSHHFTPSRYGERGRRADEGPSVAYWQPPPLPPPQFPFRPPPGFSPPGEYYTPPRRPHPHHPRRGYYHNN